MNSKLLAISISLALLLAACGSDTPTAPSIPLTATLSEVSGSVQARISADATLVSATNGLVLSVLGQVVTGEDGRARLDLSTGTLVRVAPSSTVTIQSNEPADDSLVTVLKLELGRIWIILNGGSLDVETPSGLASVRASYLMVEILPEGGVRVTCLEGTCGLGNDYGEVSLTAGQSAIITNINQPPVPGEMTDEDVIQWLAANPEATVVVPPLTQTVEPPPTSTPIPGPSAPASGPADVLNPLACRVGPNVAWPIVTYLSPGQVVNVVGKNEDGSWLEVERPDGPGTCWARATGLLVGFDLSGLPEKPSPEIPTPDLPDNAPTSITFLIGPQGEQQVCDQFFSVSVRDMDGVAGVYVVYRITFAGTIYGSGAFPLSMDAMGHYSGQFFVPALGYDILYWFQVTDALGNIESSPAYYYRDWAYCTPGGQ